VHTVFWLENLKGRGHPEDLGIDGRIMLELMLGKYSEKLWTGFIWFRIGTSEGMFERCKNVDIQKTYCFVFASAFLQA
jgi:hypothetical protein